MELMAVERALITGKWNESIDNLNNNNNDGLELAKKVIDGQFKDVLTSSAAKRIFRIKHANATEPPSIESLVDFSISGNELSQEDELIRILMGVACIHSFVQANWTGPDLEIFPAAVLSRNETSEDNISDDILNHKAIVELSYGGEPAYHLAEAATFLRLAQILFALPYGHCKSAAWWRFRAARVHQYILDEPVALPPDITASIQPLFATFASDRNLAGRLSLEEGLFEHHYAHDKAALEHFIKAAKHSGLEYELTGALGKRTKFQQTDVSQLVLLAESRDRDKESSETRDGLLESAPADHSVDIQTAVKEPLQVSRPSPGDPILPETLALNDDTLLEHTEFTSSSRDESNAKLSHIDPSSQPALHPLDQCILLSLCLNVKNSSPTHGLTTEQMAPYVSRVISHPRNWSVHTMALLLRSRLEASRTRTVTRSTLQLEALVDQMPTADSTVSERLMYFHTLPLPSKWELKRELGLRWLSLGVVRSAMEIFERLEMWEEVVKCWQSMERADKGIVIVRDLLEGRKAEADTVISRAKVGTESRRQVLDNAREAKLWCLLGDLEPHNAVAHYEKAWTVSRETSGRAMRSLGGFYFAHERYADAIPCLRKAVAINPLLARSWFVLGCCCVRESSWSEARDAFVRCVSIDDEDAESWNNLATVYLRMEPPGQGTGNVNGQGREGDAPTISTSEAALNNKLLAFRALKQGLKYQYENWRMWSNYMLVAMDVRDFSEACRAQARIVEERAAKDGVGSVDNDVIDGLVDAVTRSPGTEAGSEPSAPVTGSNESAPVPSGIKHGLPARVLDLFERTILPRVSSQRIFRAYGRLLRWQGRWADALKAHLDAYRMGRAATLEKGEEIDDTTWQNAVAEVEDIVDILQNFGPRADMEMRKATDDGEIDGETSTLPKATTKWEGQARSILRSFMARTKENFEDDPYWEKLTHLQEGLAK